MPAERDLKHHISAYQVAQKRVQDEQKALRKVVKIADEAGVSIEAIKRGLKILNTNPLQARSDMEQLSMVLKELGTPVQFAVFDVKFDDPADEAKVKGYADGKAGKDRNYGSWVKGSPAARAYDTAYDEGQLEHMPISDEAKKAIAAERAEGAAAH
jgi:hypothetical protein